MFGSDNKYEFNHLSLSSSDIYSLLKQAIKKEKSRIDVEMGEVNFNSTTALVHEVFIKLKNNNCNFISPTEREYLKTLAAVARSVIIDEIRKQTAKKRVFIESEKTNDIDYGTLLKINEVIESLSATYPVQIEAASLYYFGGMDVFEISNIVGVSESSVRNYLKFFKALVRTEFLD